MGRKPKHPALSRPALFAEQPADAGISRGPRITGTILIDGTWLLKNVLHQYMAGLRAMYDACRAHPATRSTAYVSTTICGGADIAPGPYLPFLEAQVPEFELVGGSPGGVWLSKGVEHLRGEQERMRRDGVLENKHLFFMIGDFRWDDPHRFDQAIEAYRTLEAEPGFNGFMILAGSEPNRELANRISRRRPAVHLDEVKVDEFFAWTSVVFRQASMSRPGQKVELPKPTWTLD